MEDVAKVVNSTLPACNDPSLVLRLLCLFGREGPHEDADRLTIHKTDFDHACPAVPELAEHSHRKGKNSAFRMAESFVHSVVGFTCFFCVHRKSPFTLL